MNDIRIIKQRDRRAAIQAKGWQAVEKDLWPGDPGFIHPQQEVIDEFKEKNRHKEETPDRYGPGRIISMPKLRLSSGGEDLSGVSKVQPVRLREVSDLSGSET